MKRYIGIDLHTNSFTVCYYGGEEETMRFKTYQLAAGAIRCFKQSLQPEDEMAVEATGNMDYFVDQIESFVSRVVVVNPRQFDVIRKSVSKTDKKDSKVLAYFLSKDMLPCARRKERLHRSVASLSQTRDRFVKSRAFFMNKIHGLLNGQGIKLKKESLSTEKGLNGVLDYPVDVHTSFELKLLVEQIQSLNQSIKLLDKQLVDAGRELAGYENLVSIKGIGERSAATLLAIIGDVNDFADESKLAAYFGLVPRVSSSNETTHYGRITKQGTKLGRTILVQCALVAIRYSDYLRRFYGRIKARRGSGKAIIATAKKLLGIIYNTLKNGWIFKDFGNFVLAEKK